MYFWLHIHSALKNVGHWLVYQTARYLSQYHIYGKLRSNMGDFLNTYLYNSKGVHLNNLLVQ